MFEKKSEKSDLSELAWAQEQLRENVAPRGSVKERVRNAALRLGWKHSRTRTLWYADERASDSIAAIQEDESVYSAFAAALRAFVGALHSTGTGRTDD